MVSTATLSDREFADFQRFIRETAGVALAPTKKTMLAGRLAKRLAACGVSSFGEYFRLLSSPENGAEAQRAIDLLTTHETYFYREQKHFDRLREFALAESRRSRPFRVWSAACSSGEEAYSAAMVLDDCLGAGAWEVFASDVSAQVVQQAIRAHYPEERASRLPPEYLRRYCLRGVGPQQGTMLVDAALRRRVRFGVVNLNAALPEIGLFDVIFLRNVMIYFDRSTKQAVLDRLLPCLRSGGHFYVGHAETLSGLADHMRILSPATYRKP